MGGVSEGNAIELPRLASTCRSTGGLAAAEDKPGLERLTGLNGVPPHTTYTRHGKSEAAAVHLLCLGRWVGDSLNTPHPWLTCIVNQQKGHNCNCCAVRVVVRVWRSICDFDFVGPTVWVASDQHGNTEQGFKPHGTPRTPPVQCLLVHPPYYHCVTSGISVVPGERWARWLIDW